MSEQGCFDKTAFLSPSGSQNEPWVQQILDHPQGKVVHIKTAWSRLDRIGCIRARATRFRMHYKIEPGLYAMGRPKASSPVLVSANYKLSFDILRRELSGMDVWLLVVDSDGINVWCAAGKGTFGTVEIINRIRAVNLDRIVTHRRIILPQLGAPGVHSHIIQKSTGFRVFFGPVRAGDIKAYVDRGFQATRDMRTVRFTWQNRLELIPMELNPAFKKFGGPLLLLLAVFGLQPEGILFKSMGNPGIPFLGMGIASILIGAFLIPLFIPYIPFRSFAVKGACVGTVLYAAGYPFIRTTLDANFWLIASAYLFFPALISYLSLNFTGATTFTNLSGVNKELRIAIPIYIGATSLAGLFIVIYKLTLWGKL
ncbi:MAG: mercury methylation corrinoid protein HgcA [Candidatus Aminicenantaceae bacterium]